MMGKSAHVLATLVLLAILAGCATSHQAAPNPPPLAPAPSDPKAVNSGDRSTYRAETRGREIWVTYGGASSEAARVFSLDELPATAAPAGAPAGTAFGTAAHGYHQVVLNEDHSLVAFSTKGDVHGIIALLDLGVVSGRLVGRNLRILDLLFEGSAPRLRFSADGAYLAAELSPPSGRSAVALYQMGGGKVSISGLPPGSSVQLIGWENSMLKVQDEHHSTFVVDPASGKAKTPPGGKS